MRPEFLALLFCWLALGFTFILAFTFVLATVFALSFGGRMVTSRGQVSDQDGKVSLRKMHDGTEIVSVLAQVCGVGKAVARLPGWSRGAG